MPQQPAWQRREPGGLDPRLSRGSRADILALPAVTVPGFALVCCCALPIGSRIAL